MPAAQPAGGKPFVAVRAPQHTHFWLWIMCLTGVDYFSTLGYQPSIAFEATGLLAPIATVVLVALTLFGALPVYARVADRSPHGLGSIAMLERLVRGWTGKVLVLVLLGFAATDFVITQTLSAADAAEHLIHNPLLEDDLAFSHSQLVVTLGLLTLLAATFLRGFREVIGIAVVLVTSYLVLNAIIVGSGLLHLAQHGEILRTWYDDILAGHWELAHRPWIVPQGTGWAPIAAMALLFFPKLALGLSGFETGVAVMPLIRGDTDDDPARPRGRIRSTRRLLATAAIIMSVYLLGSSLVTATLIPPEELRIVRNEEGVMLPLQSGSAANRALAYLAHGEGREGAARISPLFGAWFGSLYDVSTVLILWFAGASALAGLLNLVPQYLPRYGMAPEWTRATRPLVLLLAGIALLVTALFRADVAAQGGAYATGVLVLMSSAAAAAVIDHWRTRRDKVLLSRIPWLFAIVLLVFLYTTAANVLEKPDGIQIASCFIVAILIASLVSRTARATELRFMGFDFVDTQSRFLWNSIRYLEIPVLIPHRPDQSPHALEEKEASIRAEHRVPPEVPVVFIEAHRGDVSEFYQTPLMAVKESEGRFVLEITRCASIAHVIAAVGLEMSKGGKPPEIHFGWSDKSPVSASFDFVLFGEGNVPWMVRELIRKAEPDAAKHPRIVVG